MITINVQEKRNKKRETKNEKRETRNRVNENETIK